MEPIAETADLEGQSIIVIDKHDDRMVSPFQTWLASEIMASAASWINVLTKRDQVMPPNSGYHVALFGNYTLDRIKVVVAISIEATTGNTCAGWDEDTARAPSHPTFQQFWPMLRDTSASYTDIKVYNGNEILFHWILRGFRSDTDLILFNSSLLMSSLWGMSTKGTPSSLIAVFIRWRGLGLRLQVWWSHVLDLWSQATLPDQGLSCGKRRRLAGVSLLRDSNNRIDIKCSRTSVPGTWLTVSHICTDDQVGAGESCSSWGPWKTEQFPQLVAVHEVRGWRRVAQLLPARACLLLPGTPVYAPQTSPWRSSCWKSSLASARNGP